jgi:hypothetical protein
MPVPFTGGALLYPVLQPGAQQLRVIVEFEEHPLHLVVVAHVLHFAPRVSLVVVRVLLLSHCHI